MKFCSVSCVILYSCCAPGRSILSNIRRGWKWVTHVFKTRNDSDLPAPFCEGAGVLYIAIKNRNEHWHFKNVLFGSLLLLMAVVQTLFLVFPAQTHSSPFQDIKSDLCWSEWWEESPGHLHDLDCYICCILNWKQCFSYPEEGKDKLPFYHYVWDQTVSQFIALTLFFYFAFTISSFLCGSLIFQY